MRGTTSHCPACNDANLADRTVACVSEIAMQSKGEMHKGCHPAHLKRPAAFPHRGALEGGSFVMDSKQLMNHGLVGPLIQQGRDWVIFPVQDEQHWAAPASKIKGLLVLQMAKSGMEVCAWEVNGKNCHHIPTAQNTVIRK